MSNDELIKTNVTRASQMKSSNFTNNINGTIDKSPYHQQIETLKSGQKDNILRNKNDDNINATIKNEPEELIITDDEDLNDKNIIEEKQTGNNEKLINNNILTIKIDDEKSKKKKRFIAYEEKKKIVEIVKKNPTWTVGEIRKYTGCDYLNSTYQLRQWMDQVARNYKPMDEKIKVHSWVYEKYIDYKKKNIEITDRQLLEWANDAKKIFITNPSRFSHSPATHIWLRNFKKKYDIDKVDEKQETITIDSDNDHEEIEETLEEVKMDIEQEPLVTLKVPINSIGNSINQIDNTTSASNKKLPVTNHIKKNGILKRKVGRPIKSEKILIKNECKQRKIINCEMKKSIVRYFRKHPTLSLDELRKQTGCDGIKSYIQIRNWATILEKQDLNKRDKQKIYNKIYARCIKQLKNNIKLSEKLILGWAKYVIQRAADKNSSLSKLSVSSTWLHKFKRTYNISGDLNDLQLYPLNDKFTTKKPNNKLINDDNNNKLSDECNEKIIPDDIENEKLLKIQNWVYDRCIEYKKNNLLINIKTIMVWANEAKKIYLSNCQAFESCKTPTTKKWIQDFINIYGITGKPCRLEINHLNHQQKLNNGYRIIDIAGSPENELMTKLKQEKEEDINQQPMNIEIISFGSLSSGEVIYPSNFEK